ncbi:TIGR04282 family arsenosugar biosynthesis glycosyltransferase [Aquiflexum sp. LQ15W]|uniref:TIGR04282 family arsenosugar biosynthesis glycosyltransferase n=1 Tax=Cognataquiflexum nitidum TaxID=2922272 RepID=UPI001F1491BC|nr:TIGR04282 family arsenosugar biosynthesis glycosyltransferase [Cognataquiflexum nitidum]MCH6200607.1 TIGR04282 family arsenosugar biosynthesis glycosyltransferase [Cognataquiflexum nitidum]
MKNENALIVFQKNAVLGKVKSRLAATIGEKKALEIYRSLLLHTYRQIEKLEDVDISIFYSDFIEENSFGQFKPDFEKVQIGVDLGERMSNAFFSLFQKCYKKVIIIGTDCPEIRTADIKDAFQALKKKDVCIGPALDGGYYLLGMCQFYGALFENIPWSSSEVWKRTLEILNHGQISYDLMKTLRDIDTEEDMIAIFPE